MKMQENVIHTTKLRSYVQTIREEIDKANKATAATTRQIAKMKEFATVDILELREELADANTRQDEAEKKLKTLETLTGVKL